MTPNETLGRNEHQTKLRDPRQPRLTWVKRMIPALGVNYQRRDGAGGIFAVLTDRVLSIDDVEIKPRPSSRI
jgi:hypothetical protein